MNRIKARLARTTCFALSAIFVFLPAVLAGQGRQAQFRERTVTPIARGEWTGPRLVDGQPDIQGHWSNTIGNHNNLTDPNGGVGDDDETPGTEAQNQTRTRNRGQRAP